MLKVLVAGCARGATRWAHEAIKQAGHDVSYDSVFHKHATSQNLYAGIAKATHPVEVSWRAAPFLEHPALESVRVVSVYRDPFAVANSILWSGAFSSGGNDLIRAWYDFFCTHLPELGGWYRNRSSQASLYYALRWGQLLQKAPFSAYAEQGAGPLLEACGLENKTGKLLQNKRINASGCRAVLSHHTCRDFPRI